VQLTKHKYLEIGRTIFTFEIADDIIGYYSQVGNSDVIYPYAIGTQNTYLLIEDAFLPNHIITDKDPYTQFYTTQTPTETFRKLYKLPKKKLIDIKK
jgi:hypothetical protein